jgi:hypothetical protein
MNTPTTPHRRARKGVAVIGASSVAIGLAVAVGLLWVVDRGEAAVAGASGQPSAYCASAANAPFAAL